MRCRFAGQVGIAKDLGQSHVGKWEAGLRTRKYEVTRGIGCAGLAEKGKRARSQWYHVFDASFHALCRYCPQRIVQIDLLPNCKPDLAAARRGQNEEFESEARCGPTF